MLSPVIKMKKTLKRILESFQGIALQNNFTWTHLPIYFPKDKHNSCMKPARTHIKTSFRNTQILLEVTCGK